MAQPLERYENMNILIVEDDSASYHLITEFLLPFKFNYYRATNDIETMKLLFTNRIYHLIIIEVRVTSPRNSGIELTKAIKITFPNIPIIVQTSIINSKKQLASILSKTDFFITKPYCLKDFTKKVLSILDSGVT